MLEEAGPKLRRDDSRKNAAASKASRVMERLTKGYYCCGEVMGYSFVLCDFLSLVVMTMF